MGILRKIEQGCIGLRRDCERFTYCARARWVRQGGLEVSRAIVSLKKIENGGYIGIMEKWKLLFRVLGLGFRAP